MAVEKVVHASVTEGDKITNDFIRALQALDLPVCSKPIINVGCTPKSDVRQRKPEFNARCDMQQGGLISHLARRLRTRPGNASPSSRSGS